MWWKMKDICLKDRDSNSSRKAQLVLSVLNGWMRGDNGIKGVKEIKKTGSWRKQNTKEQTQ